MNDLWWNATRAAGLVAWAASVAVVVTALAARLPLISRRVDDDAADQGHRWLSGFAVLAVVTHATATLVDGRTGLSARDLLLPGDAGWEPMAVTVGVAAAWALCASFVAGALAERLEGSRLDLARLFAAAAAVGGSAHAVMVGSDVGNPAVWGAVVAVALVAGTIASLDTRRHLVPRVLDPNRPESLLEEMRQRLAELPVPESTPQPVLARDAATRLPRRAPVNDEAPVERQIAVHPEDADAPRTLLRSLTDPTPPTPPVAPVRPETAFSPDPFADLAQPAPPDPAAWAPPSPADPFARPAPEPGLGDLPTRAAPGPAPTHPSAGPWDTPPAPTPPLATPAPTSPFATPTPPPPPVHPAPAPPTPAPAFPPTPASPAAPASFFEPTADPTPSPPVPTPEPHPAPVPPPTAAEPRPAPPPPPVAAVDPRTGRPDEEAYRAWLREWLAFAERYGDETPDDPRRRD